jgi:hypothetical protein
LFSAVDVSREPKIRAGLDFNVLANSLKPQSASTDGAHAIMEDWLTEVVDLFVTPEISTEANRDKDSTRRNRILQLALRFDTCSAQLSQVEEKRKLIDSLFESSPQEQSDLSHLAWCAADNIDFFVTADTQLYKKSADVYDRVAFGLYRRVTWCCEQTLCFVHQSTNHNALPIRISVLDCSRKMTGKRFMRPAL